MLLLCFLTKVIVLLNSNHSVTPRGKGYTFESWLKCFRIKIQDGDLLYFLVK